MPRSKKTESGENEFKTQLARALADYDNLQKRVEREKSEWQRFASLNIITKLLPVLDILYQAQNHLKDQGLEFAIKEFENVLGEEGIEKVKVEPEQTFDHTIHEVVEVLGGGKEGTVAEVVQVGWEFSNGNLIRPAKVKVYGKMDNVKEGKNK